MGKGSNTIDTTKKIGNLTVVAAGKRVGGGKPQIKISNTLTNKGNR